MSVGRCPWCSAPLDDTSVTTCPSCGAALQEQVEGDLPGLTQIDAMALATQRRARGGGVRALIGLTDEDTEGSPARAVPEPPSAHSPTRTRSLSPRPNRTRSRLPPTLPPDPRMAGRMRRP